MFFNAPCTLPPTPPFGGGEQPLILEGEDVTSAGTDISSGFPPPAPPTGRGELISDAPYPPSYRGLISEAPYPPPTGD